VGKVRIEMVKRVALELVEKYPRSFNQDFDNNKRFLATLNVDISKKMRNKVAGYATRIIRTEMNFDAGLGEVEPEN